MGAKAVAKKSSRMAKAKAKAAAKSAAALAALAPDKPLWEKDEDEQPAGKPCKRRRDRSIEKQVAKCVRDNFSNFKASQETLLLNAQGKSLTELLTEGRLKAEAKGPSAPVFGKHYYDKLRLDQYTDSPYKKLRVSNDKEELSEDLTMALGDLNRHPKSFDNLYDFLETGPILNQKGLCSCTDRRCASTPRAAPTQWPS